MKGWICQNRVFLVVREWFGMKSTGSGWTYWKGVAI